MKLVQMDAKRATALGLGAAGVVGSLGAMVGLTALWKIADLRLLRHTSNFWGNVHSFNLAHRVSINNLFGTSMLSGVAMGSTVAAASAGVGAAIACKPESNPVKRETREAVGASIALVGSSAALLGTFGFLIASAGVHSKFQQSWSTFYRMWGHSGSVIAPQTFEKFRFLSSVFSLAPAAGVGVLGTAASVGAAAVVWGYEPEGPEFILQVKVREPAGVAELRREEMAEV